jgi:hypothetical protein
MWTEPEKGCGGTNFRTAAGMLTGLPSVLDMLPIRSGTPARYLVRLARNRRVDVAWVLDVHARSVGPRLRLKVILSDVLGLAGR